MISKKLLEEILNVKIINFTEELGGEYDPCLQIDYDKGMLLLNIYELMYKCKEWALSQEYYVKSDLVFVELFKIHSYIDDIPTEAFSGDTEPENVFTACQWILDNEDN